MRWTWGIAVWVSLVGCQGNEGTQDLGETAASGDVTQTGSEQPVPAANTSAGATTASSATGGVPATGGAESNGFASETSGPTAPTPSGPLDDESSTSAEGTSGPSSTDVTADICPLAPALASAATGLAEFPLRSTALTEDFGLGVRLTAEDGTLFELSQLSFFASNPQLETETGERVEAAFVDDAGAPLPYGLFVYDAEDPPSSFGLAAPPGQYVALHFDLGVSKKCAGTLGTWPLSVDNKLYWTWGALYMCLRVEGFSFAGDAGAAQFAYHLGDVPQVITNNHVRVAGAWEAAPQRVTNPEITLDVGKLLAPRPTGELLAGAPVTADWMIDNFVQRAFVVVSEN